MIHTHSLQIVSLDDGGLFDRATLSIAEAESGNDANKTLLVARYRALSRFRLQEYFDREGEGVLMAVMLCRKAMVTMITIKAGEAAGCNVPAALTVCRMCAAAAASKRVLRGHSARPPLGAWI